MIATFAEPFNSSFLPLGSAFLNMLALDIDYLRLPPFHLLLLQLARGGFAVLLLLCPQTTWGGTLRWEM